MLVATADDSTPADDRDQFRFSWWWQCQLARFQPTLELPLVALGQRLPEQAWLQEDEPAPFVGCTMFRRGTGEGTIRVGTIDDQVEAVFYDLDVYRDSQAQVVKKLQTILAFYERDTGKLYRWFHGPFAIMFRDSERRFAASYSVMADTFFIHTAATKYERS